MTVQEEQGSAVDVAGGVEAFGGLSLEQLLQPLDSPSGPCGPDLEHDNEMLELGLAAQGRKETQFAAGVPPNWRDVQRRAEHLLERSRDLRAAMYWARASVRVHGFAALPAGLGLLHRLLERFRDDLHPLPDPEDGVPYARMSTLALLKEPDGLLGDLRQAALCSPRGIGELRVRSVEAALNLLPPRAGEPELSREQLEQILVEASRADPTLRIRPALALEHLEALESLIQQHSSDTAPDLQPLRRVLAAVAAVMPPPPIAAETPVAAPAGAAAAPAPIFTRGTGEHGLSGGVRSREEALRAIDMVCEYLERTEPTNPAPLFLRRAQKLISHSFLQLVKELAPEALAEVARVVGVDPETVAVDARPN